MPEDLAYIIYTSGSAGRPKATTIPHRGIVRLVEETEFLDAGTDDVIAFAASVSFDAATLKLWGSLSEAGLSLAARTRSSRRGMRPRSTRCA